MTKEQLKEQIKINEEKIEKLLEEKQSALKKVLLWNEKDTLRKIALVGLASFVFFGAFSIGTVAFLFASQSIVNIALLSVSVVGMVAGAVTSLVCDNKLNKNNPEIFEKVSEIDMEITNLRDENMSLQKQINNIANNTTQNMSQIPNQNNSILEENYELKIIQNEKSKYTKNPIRSGKR